MAHMGEGGREGTPAMASPLPEDGIRSSGPSKLQIQRGAVVMLYAVPDEKLKHWTRGVCITRKREVRTEEA